MDKDVVYSKNVLMMAKKADGLYYPFACVEEITFKRTAGVLETTSLGSGNAAEYSYDKKTSWTATLNGVMLLQDVRSVKKVWTFLEIQDAVSLFKTLDTKFYLLDTFDDMLTMTGRVLIPEYGFTAAIGDGGELARFNVQFQGTGILEQTDNDGAGEIFNLTI
jgi:hypothetical protein